VEEVDEVVSRVRFEVVEGAYGRLVVEANGGVGEAAGEGAEQVCS
jgi:hypothetical protein